MLSKVKRSSCSDVSQTSIEANLFLDKKIKKNMQTQKERKTKQNKRLATDTIRRRFKSQHERNLTSILKSGRRIPRAENSDELISGKKYK